MEDVETGAAMTEAGAQLFDDLMRFKPEGMTANAWAVQAGVSRTIWSDLRRHGNPSRRTLERLLSAAGSSLAEFEALRIGELAPASVEGSASVSDGRPAGWRAAPLPPIPLLETVPAGEWGGAGSGIDLIELRRGDVRGHVARPASMAGDREAYAMAILGQAMWPRFRPDRQLLVSPDAPVAPGDDVAVQLAPSLGGGTRVLVKELARRTASFVELRQFTPDRTFRVDTAEFIGLHKVVGEAI